MLMSKNRVTEDELAQTLGLDRLDDHPLNFRHKPDSKEISQVSPGPFGNVVPTIEEKPITAVRQRSNSKSVQQLRAFQTPSEQISQETNLLAEKNPEFGTEKKIYNVPKKADIYPRRIGIGMNDDLKSQLDALTAIVQRLRTVKHQRHTTNTVVRCALRYVIENMTFQEGDAADTEEELLELFRQRLGKRLQR